MKFNMRTFTSKPFYDIWLQIEMLKDIFNETFDSI